MHDGKTFIPKFDHQQEINALPTAVCSVNMANWACSSRRTLISNHGNVWCLYSN